MYDITAAPRQETPTEHQAVQWLVERCLPLLPPRSEWPEKATDWRDFARHSPDLMADGHCWRRDKDGHEYLLNYVDADSPAWKEAIEAARPKVRHGPAVPGVGRLGGASAQRDLSD